MLHLGWIVQAKKLPAAGLDVNTFSRTATVARIDLLFKGSILLREIPKRVSSRYG